MSVATAPALIVAAGRAPLPFRAQFFELCEKSEGGYKGSPIHRIKAGAWLQAGDTATGNGDGGASASGEQPSVRASATRQPSHLDCTRSARRTAAD